MTDPGPGPRYAHNGAADIAFEELSGAGGEPLLLVMGLGVSRFWWPAGLIDELGGQGFHAGRRAAPPLGRLHGRGHDR